MRRLRTFTLAALSLVTMLMGSHACGGAPAPDPDEAFRRIQVHEATIAHRGAEAARCEPGDACPAAEAVCEAAEALCEVARELDDADALARCELGRRRCRGGTP